MIELRSFFLLLFHHRNNPGSLPVSGAGVWKMFSFFAFYRIAIHPTTNYGSLHVLVDGSPPNNCQVWKLLWFFTAYTRIAIHPFSSHGSLPAVVDKYCLDLFLFIQYPTVGCGNCFDFLDCYPSIFQPWFPPCGGAGASRCLSAAACGTPVLVIIIFAIIIIIIVIIIITIVVIIIELNISIIIFRWRASSNPVGGLSRCCFWQNDQRGKLVLKLQVASKTILYFKRRQEESLVNTSCPENVER